MHPSLTDAPPYTVAPVLYDHRIFPLLALIAYTGPSLYVDPAKTTPLATVTGPLAVALLGSAVDHSTFPVRASMATQPPPVVMAVDGLRVKLRALELTMLV